MKITRLLRSRKMKLAVFSDTHDNIWKIDKALALTDEAEVIIHCGDLCSPFVIKHFGKAAKKRPIHVIWGNNDGDIQMISQVASVFPEFKLHGILAEFEVDGVRIALNHYPKIARALAGTGDYDLVCYGHDHTAHNSRVGECVLLNPGELMGMMGSSSFAMFDTTDRSVEFIEVE